MLGPAWLAAPAEGYGLPLPGVLLGRSRAATAPLLQRPRASAVGGAAEASSRAGGRASGSCCSGAFGGSSSCVQGRPWHEEVGSLAGGSAAIALLTLASRSFMKRRRRSKKAKLALAVFGPTMLAEPVLVSPAPPYDPDDPFSDWSFDKQNEAYGPVALELASYYTLLAASDWEGALKLLGDMRNEGHQPDTVSYNLAVKACRKAGKGQEAHDLIEEMWLKNVETDAITYREAIGACQKGMEWELAQKLSDELRDWGPDPHWVNYHAAPRLAWDRPMRRAGVGIRNIIRWNGRGKLPDPPHAGCWLFPTQEDTALAVSEHAAALREKGWKIATCSWETIAKLGNKKRFHQLACDLGLEGYLPKHYRDPCYAKYPCVMKPAEGTWGKNTFILWSEEEARAKSYYLGQEKELITQELITGPMEYSTSLLCLHGEILDWACTRYTYNKNEYVWPNNVEEIGNDHVSVKKEHLEIMQKFLVGAGGFTGICNFNYKFRENGEIVIFESNPRMGGDFAWDIPRPRAKGMLAKLDFYFK